MRYGLVFFSLVLLPIWPSVGLAAERKGIEPYNTDSSGWVKVPRSRNGAGGTCADTRCCAGESECPAPGGCATCRKVRVLLPPDARFRSAWYFMKREDGLVGQVSVGRNVREGRFTDPVQTSTEKNIVVEVTFRNWNSDVDHDVYMEVDWSPGLSARDASSRP